MKTIQFIETADGKTKLDAVVEIGTLTIQPSTGKEITVDASYRHMNVWVERQGDTVVVRAEREESLLESLGRLLTNDHPKADLVISLPTYCAVQAKTVTGQLEIEGIQAPVTGRVIAGELKLQDIGGPIYAKTVTGQLTYTGELSEESHRFETVTGEVVLTIPETTNARLSAQTTVGDMNCRLPLTDRHDERHLVGGKLHGMLGTGAGRIKAKITTGSLQIRPLTLKQKEPKELLELA